MNKIHKLKFSQTLMQWAVVSEITTGAGKTAGTGQLAGAKPILIRFAPLVWLIKLAFGLLPMAVLANPNLPTGGQIVLGQGAIETVNQKMTIQQSSPSMVASWDSFDIGQNHHVQFVQPSANALALNRVTGGRESQIMGTLTANGQVFLINPNGVLFGKDASVNTAGLVVSTKNIANADFMQGNYRFQGADQEQAQIINQGNLTVSAGGYIVLAANQVHNSGSIIAPAGQAVLTASDQVQLQLDQAGLTSVSVNGALINAMVANSGLISAPDGKVYLTAKGRDLLLNTVVNNSGTIEARGISSQGGEIVLDGGDSGVVSHAGQARVDSALGQGGTVTVTGEKIHLAPNSHINASGKTGGGAVYIGGGWQGKDPKIKNAKAVVMSKSAVIDASAVQRGNAGTAVLWSDDYTNFQGRILATGGSQAGNGGQVETSSHNNLQAFGQVDASASHGKAGNWLLDPANVTIVDSASNSAFSEIPSGNQYVFDTTADGAQILNASINYQLNSGTNVKVQTSGFSGTNQTGDITVNANISKTGGGDATLTLQADKNITVKTGIKIESTAGKLGLDLLAGTTASDATVELQDQTLISLNGGNFKIDAGSGLVNLTGVTINNANRVDIATNGYEKITNDNWVPPWKIVTLSKVNIVATDAINISSVVLGQTKSSSLSFQGNSSFKANQITIKGENLFGQNPRDYFSRTSIGTAVGVEFYAGSNTSFDGNTNITGISHILAVVANGHSSVNFANGSSSIEGISNAIPEKSGNRPAHWANEFHSVIGNSSDIKNNTDVMNINVTNTDLDLIADASVHRTGHAFGSSTSTSGGFVFSGNGNVTVTGRAKGGNAVSLHRFDNTNLTGTLTISGTSTDTSTVTKKPGVGVIYESSAGATLKNVTITGSSDHGSGVFINSTGNAALVDLTGSTITGNLAKGDGIYIGGNNIKISDAILSGTASTDGAGVKLELGAGYAIGNIKITGVSDSGQGVLLASALTLDNATVNGTASSGVGIEVEADLNNTKGSKLTGRASSGTASTGIRLKGNVINDATSAIEGTNSSSGTGVELANVVTTAAGNNKSVGVKVTGGSVTGNSDAGTAVKVSGDNVILDAATLKGDTKTGTGVEVAVSLTNTKGSTVTGNATERGIGVKLVGNVTGDSVTGNSDIGTAVKVTGNRVTLDEVILKGNTKTGKGIEVAGNLTTANSTIKGIASDNGIGVELVGSVTGGEVTGDSDVGVAVKVTGNNVALHDVTMKGNTKDGKGIEVAGNLTNTNSTVEGKATGSGTGVELAGNVTGGRVTGSSDASTAVKVTGANVALDNVTLKGDTKDGKGVEVAGSLTNNNGSTVEGAATGNGTGVELAGNVTGGSVTGNSDASTAVKVTGANVALDNVTLKGNTKDGKGVEVAGNLTNTNSTVEGKATGNGTGVELAGNVTGGSVTGNSDAGTAVKVTGANVNLNNVTLKGDTKDGKGIEVAGSLTNTGNSTVAGSATGNGVGVELAGNVTNGSVTGNSDAGTAVKVTGANVTVDNVTLKGDSKDGTGIEVAGNLDAKNTSKLEGQTTGNGTGVKVAGSLTNNNGSTVEGKATGSGTGVELAGNVTGGSVTGNSDAGTAVKVTGANVVLDNLTLKGDTKDGKGIEVAGSLTNTGNSTVEGKATGSGIGVELAGNVTNGSVTGNSDAGTAVKVTGTNATLDAVTLKGNTKDGKGIEVAGSLTNNNGSTVEGVASGSGTGVELAGNVTNGSVTGNSDAGTAVKVTGANVALDNVTLKGDSKDGTGIEVAGNLDAKNTSKIEGQTTGNGTGVKVAGSLTGDATSALKGMATGTGTGVELTGSVIGANIDGTATTGIAVDIVGNITSSQITGTSDNNVAVNIRGANAALDAVTLKGNTVTGQGIKVAGNLTSTNNSTLEGKATGSGTGVELAGNVTGGSVTGNSDAGTAVKATGANVALDNVTLKGDTKDGKGIEVAGSLTNNNGSTVAGSATGNGVGVELAGNVTNGSVTGNSDAGTAVKVTGTNATLDAVTLKGNTKDGKGIEVAGSLTNNNGSTVEGKATGSGTGVELAGNVTNGSVTGNSDAGTAVKVTGANATLDAVTLKGNTKDGTGIEVAGNLDAKNTSKLEGQTTGSGTGVKVAGSLTNNGSTVEGVASGSGTGVELSGNVTNGSVTGNSDAGTAVKVTGANVALDNVTLKGDTKDGKGIEVAGSLTNNNGSTVEGKATGSGTGVELAGNVTNGSVTGNSDAGSAVNINGAAVRLSQVAINAKAVSGDAVAIGGNVSIDQYSAQNLQASAQSGSGLALTDATIKAADDQGQALALPVELVGNSVSGNGVTVTGNSNIQSLKLKGVSAAAQKSGLRLGGKLTIADAISGLAGHNSGAGTALTLDGATIDAASNGAAGQNFVMQADTENGTAIKIEGDNYLAGTKLNAKASGTGVAVDIAGNVSHATINADANTGRAVNINGADVGLSQVALVGSIKDGVGIKISGNLTNTNDSTLLGITNGNGNSAGIELAGNVTGGDLHGQGQCAAGVYIAHGSSVTLTGLNATGQSTYSAGVRVDGHAALVDAAVTGRTTYGMEISVTGGLTQNQGSSVNGVVQPFVIDAAAAGLMLFKPPILRQQENVQSMFLRPSLMPQIKPYQSQLIKTEVCVDAQCNMLGLKRELTLNTSWLQQVATKGVN